MLTSHVTADVFLDWLSALRCGINVGEIGVILHEHDCWEFIFQQSCHGKMMGGNIFSFYPDSAVFGVVVKVGSSQLFLGSPSSSPNIPRTVRQLFGAINTHLMFQVSLLLFFLADFFLNEPKWGTLFCPNFCVCFYRDCIYSFQPQKCPQMWFGFFLTHFWSMLAFNFCSLGL